MATDVYVQEGEVRFDWGPAGAACQGRTSRTLVVVDVFSFTTAVDIAVARGAIVYPFPRHDETAKDFAVAVGAQLAVDRREISAQSPYSLWPRSLEQIPAGTRLVLPSPNGSAISAAAASLGCEVLAGCLRNRRAVANSARHLGAPVTVIAAGERWPDGSLRPAYEDLIGAAAIISLLIQAGLQPSGEARAAGAAFAEAEGDLLHQLRATASSRELVAMGFHDDAEIAAELDSSEAIPQLRDGAFASLVR